MTLYLSHETALGYWLYGDGALDQLRVGGMPGLDDATCSYEEASRLVGGPLLSELAAIPPLHVLTPRREDRLRSQLVTPHCLSSSLSGPSFYEVSEGVMVASPALALCGVSNQLSLPVRASIEMQLCGSFRLTGAGGLRAAPPLLTLSQLCDSLRTLKGIRGSNSALQSTQWVIEGSASPMETTQLLLMHLPQRYGGYGVRPPQLNYRVDVGDRARRCSSKRCYFCDLYWPDAKLDVEYDSDAFHTTPERIASDSSRRTALDYMGISVITVTRQQLTDAYEFNRIVRLVARKLGQRIATPTDPRTMRRRIALRKELMGWQKMLAIGRSA